MIIFKLAPYLTNLFLNIACHYISDINFIDCQITQLSNTVSDIIFNYSDYIQISSIFNKFISKYCLSLYF